MQNVLKGKKMADVEYLVEKFRTKLLAAQEMEKYKTEVISPLVGKIFIDQFAGVFQNLTDEINSKVGSRVITFISEGKNRFTIEGLHHRIIFQKGKIEVFDSRAVLNIIPIYVWKGVTKHLGPISIVIDPNTEETKWDIPFGNTVDYSKDLFSKLVDDEDFSM